MVKLLRLLAIVITFLPLSGMHRTGAAEIEIVSPGAYEDIEGAGSVEGSLAPYRFQQVFPAADFADLGNEPHWLVDFTVRPDQSLTSPRTVHVPDHEIRLATMPVGPPNLSSRFDDNLGSDFKHFYRGPHNLVAEPVPFFGSGLFAVTELDPACGHRQTGLVWPCNRIVYQISHDLSSPKVMPLPKG